jgi:hypothetical protein
VKDYFWRTMMTRLTSLLLGFIFIIDILHAQNEKSFSAGLMLGPTLSATTLINNSVSVFVHTPHSRYVLSFDFYLDKIRGIGCAYQHHFLKEGKKNNWFGELNLRYVKYASGYADNGPIDYFNPSALCNDQMLFDNSMMLSAISFGREIPLKKIFYFDISLGAGAYWKKQEILDCWKIPNRDSEVEAIHPEAVLKVGIGIAAYRK